MSTPPKLKAGDIFCTCDPRGGLAPAISALQGLWAADGAAEYSHAGVILAPGGTTFEALWRVRRQDLWHAYPAPARLLIGRHVGMNAARFDRGWKVTRGYEGRHYPVWRLGLHIIPPLARFFSSGEWLVCSELAAKFLWGADLLSYYKGVTPDHLADAIRLWDDFEVVYERAPQGECPAPLPN